jgi:hypothetical protein
MKYPYWKVPPVEATEPWTRRPVVRVALGGPTRELTLTALVDSGSDYSLFRTDVAEALGIDLSSCKQSVVSGIEYDPAPCYLTDVTITVEHLKPVTVPVMFWERQPVALIGQVGFFDLHRIKFERDHDTFEITPGKKAAGK